MKRKEERPHLYDDPKEAAIYARNSSHGFVKFVEQRFVRQVLKNFPDKSGFAVLDVGAGAGHVPIELLLKRPASMIPGFQKESRVHKPTHQISNQTFDLHATLLRAPNDYCSSNSLRPMALIGRLVVVKFLKNYRPSNE